MKKKNWSAFPFKEQIKPGLQIAGRALILF
jgi:hypothetical protein